MPGAAPPHRLCPSAQRLQNTPKSADSVRQRNGPGRPLKVSLVHGAPGRPCLVPHIVHIRVHLLACAVVRCMRRVHVWPAQVHLPLPYPCIARDNRQGADLPYHRHRGPTHERVVLPLAVAGHSHKSLSLSGVAAGIPVARSYTALQLQCSWAYCGAAARAAPRGAAQGRPTLR